MGYIYCITNVINNKQYVGKCVTSIEQRFKEHCADSKRRKLENRPLYKAFNKYGIDNFKLSLLETVEDLNLLSEREIFWISELDTRNNGYNATYGGDGRLLYDHQLIIKTYHEVKNVKQTAKKCGCCVDTVLTILKCNNVKHYSVYTGNCNQPISVYRIDPNTSEILQQYDSMADAVRWLMENNYIKKISGGVRSHISYACKHSNSICYKFRWKRVDDL